MCRVTTWCVFFLALASGLVDTARAGSDTDNLHHYQITNDKNPAGIQYGRTYSYADANTHFPGQIYTFPSADITQELVNSITDASKYSNLSKGCTVTTTNDLDASDASNAVSLRKALARARNGECTYGNSVAWVCGQYMYDTVYGGQGCTSSIPLAASWAILQVVRIPASLGEIQITKPLIVPPGVVILGGVPPADGAISYDYAKASAVDQQACNPDGKYTNLKNCLPPTVRTGSSVITIAPSVAPKDFQTTDSKGNMTRALLYVESGEVTQYGSKPGLYPTYISGPVHIAGITLKDAPYTALESAGHHGVYEWIKIIQDPAKKQYSQGTKRNLKDQSKWTCVDYDKTAKKCNQPNAPLYSCADPAVPALQCMQYFVCATADGQEYLCKDHPDYGGTAVILGDGAYTGHTPGVLLHGADNIVQRMYFDRPGDLVRTVAELPGAPLPGNYVSRLHTSSHVSGVPYWSDVTAPVLTKAEKYNPGASNVTYTPGQGITATPIVSTWSTAGWSDLVLSYDIGPMTRDFEIEVYVQTGDSSAESFDGDTIRRIEVGGYHYDGITAHASGTDPTTWTIQIDVLKKFKLALNDRIILAVHEFAAQPGTTEEAWNWVRSSSVPYTRMSEPIAMADLDVDGDGLNQYCEILQGWSDDHADTQLTRESTSKTTNSTYYKKERLDPETCMWKAYEAGGTSTIPPASDVPPTRNTWRDRHDDPERTTPEQRRRGARDRTDRGPAPRIVQPKGDKNTGGGGNSGNNKGGTTNPPGDPTSPLFGGGENGGGGSTGGDGGGTGWPNASCVNGLVLAGSTTECPPPGDPKTDDEDDTSDKQDGDDVTPPAQSESPCGQNLIQFGTLCVANPCGRGLVWNTATQQCDNGAGKDITPSATPGIVHGCSLLL